MCNEDTSPKADEGLALCEIENGVYWDSALIKIQNAMVQSWTYVRTKDFDRASRNIGAIHKALVEALNIMPQKKVAYHLLKQGKVRSPVFIWKRGNTFVAFTHSPIKDYEKSQPFICQLTVAPDLESLQQSIDVAKDELDSDSTLFIDVTNNNAKAKSDRADRESRK